MINLGLLRGTKLALAVSGGGDSLALAYLFSAIENANAPVLIVDHGLQKDSAKHAKAAARRVKRAGLAHAILTWKPPRGLKAGIEEAAREARYRLMGAWCRTHGIGALLTAHTLDDQAETFLLRLGRGSGVDGLSSMRAVTPLPVPGFEDILLCRPLLGIARAQLRAYLKTKNIPWHEDPMNSDPRFARVRVRALLPILEEAGLPVRRIAEAARHLARAREALEAAAQSFLERHSQTHAGMLVLNRTALLAAPQEIALRVLVRSFALVTGEKRKPRFEPLEALYRGLTEPAFQARTLAGCQIRLSARARAPYGRESLEIRLAPPRRQLKKP